MPDHNYISFIVTAILLVISIIGIMLRGWFKHVNDNLNLLWQKYDEENKSREKRWSDLHLKCEAHTAKISNIEGRLGWKNRVYSPPEDKD